MERHVYSVLHEGCFLVSDRLMSPCGGVCDAIVPVHLSICQVTVSTDDVRMTVWWGSPSSVPADDVFHNIQDFAAGSNVKNEAILVPGVIEIVHIV